MKVRLLKDARIRHYEGEIVEVSPEEGFFLVTTSGAIEVDAVKTDVAEEIPEKKVAKAEAPEKKVVKTVKKTVAKKK